MIYVKNKILGHKNALPLILEENEVNDLSSGPLLNLAKKLVEKEPVTPSSVASSLPLSKKRHQPLWLNQVPLLSKNLLTQAQTGKHSFHTCLHCDQ